VAVKADFTALTSRHLRARIVLQISKDLEAQLVLLAWLQMSLHINSQSCIIQAILKRR